MNCDGLFVTAGEEIEARDILSHQANEDSSMNILVELIDCNCCWKQENLSLTNKLQPGASGYCVNILRPIK